MLCSHKWKKVDPLNCDSCIVEDSKNQRSLSHSFVIWSSICVSIGFCLTSLTQNGYDGMGKVCFKTDLFLVGKRFFIQTNLGSSISHIFVSAITLLDGNKLEVVKYLEWSFFSGASEENTYEVLFRAYDQTSPNKNVVRKINILIEHGLQRSAYSHEHLIHYFLLRAFWAYAFSWDIITMSSPTRTSPTLPISTAIPDLTFCMRMNEKHSLTLIKLNLFFRFMQEKNGVTILLQEI